MLTNTELFGLQILLTLTFPLILSNKYLYRPWLTTLRYLLIPKLTWHPGTPSLPCRTRKGVSVLCWRPVLFQRAFSRWKSGEEKIFSSMTQPRVFPPLHLKIPQWHVTICHLKLKSTDMHSRVYLGDRIIFHEVQHNYVTAKFKISCSLLVWIHQTNTVLFPCDIISLIII